MKKLLFLLVPLLFFGQIPTYYSTINFSAEPQQVETDLSNLISSTHTNVLTYTPGVWEVLKITDLDPEDTTNSKVLLIYGYNDTDGDYTTDRTRSKYENQTGNYSEGKWNREHVYCKSLGTPNLGTENAGSDAHALRAVDASMNSSRSNRKFAEGNGNAHITNQGNWYPGDEWKGDVARMMMYMHLRYPSQTPANNIAISSHTTHPEMPDIFLEWNKEDPVSAYEIQRNNHLENVQGNRNPFIDNPYLATLIWGGENAEDKWNILNTEEIMTPSIKFTVYPNPTTDVIYLDYESKNKMLKTFVVDMTGRIVAVDDNLNDNKVEMPKTKGTYIVHFEFNNQIINKKVIVK